MFAAEVGEVVVAGGAAGLPVGGVVDVGADGGAGAARESAAAVADAEVAGEVGGDPVAGSAVGEVRAGLGVGEDPAERGGVRGEGRAVSASIGP